jgi:dihydropteroate synthase
MIDEGAAIIDVGGESTRPGHTKISDMEEIERVCPVIEKIKENFDIPISVDTYKSQVADMALTAGAHMINDIHGLKYDARLAEIAVKYDVPVCLMHNRDNMDYGKKCVANFIEGVLSDLRESIRIAKNAGIADDKIIIDPGVGFAKDYEMNLWITNNVDALNVLGYPVMLATSRKSMIGLALDLPSDEREEGTLATTVLGVTKGISFVRVHNVKMNVRAIKMTKTLMNSVK